MAEQSLQLPSANRKGLDVAVYLPRELLRFDTEIRKWVSETISRGQLTIRIQSPLEGVFHSSLILLKDLKMFWEKMAFQLGYPESAVTLGFLTEQMRSLPQNVPTEDQEQIAASLKGAVDMALKELQRMKEKEGEALEKDIRMRLKIIEKSLEKIALRAKDAPVRSRQKLEEKVKELSLPSAEVEMRLMQEVLFLVERSDITEELTRLHSHINQFINNLGSPEKSIGRTLDFLTQEMHREINTIAAKSSDLEISQEAIVVKSEIEKIREQIQKIE